MQFPKCGYISMWHEKSQVTGAHTSKHFSYDLMFAYYYIKSLNHFWTWRPIFSFFIGPHEPCGWTYSSLPLPSPLLPCSSTYWNSGRCWGDSGRGVTRIHPFFPYCTRGQLSDSFIFHFPHSSIFYTQHALNMFQQILNKLLLCPIY